MLLCHCVCLAECVGEVTRTAENDFHIKTEVDATVNPQPSGSGIHVCQIIHCVSIKNNPFDF